MVPTSALASMIKRIELVNFMSHRHTVIEPADGLTVLVGPNNCGKSAVVTALQILCYNDNSTFVTRHGEKECSISIETDDGHLIRWGRKKAGSTWYEIDGQRFDRLRSRIPDELNNILRMPKVSLDQSPEAFDIHFGSQKQPVFLLNESGRAAAGFFAASSDASRLIEMQKLHGQRVRDSTRDLNRLVAESNELESGIQALAAVPGIALEFAATEEQLRQLEGDQQRATRLGEIVGRIREVACENDRLNSRAKVLADTEPPPMLESTAELRTLGQSIARLTGQRKSLESQTNALAAMEPPPMLDPSDPLRAMCRSIGTLASQQKNLGSQSSAMRGLDAPPPMDDVSALKDQLLRIRNSRQRAVKLEALCHSLSALEQPPEIGDSQPLSSMIKLIAETRRKILQLEAQQESLLESVSRLDDELECWFAENPTCPTCRQPWTKRHLLPTGKAGRS